MSNRPIDPVPLQPRPSPSSQYAGCLRWLFELFKPSLPTEHSFRVLRPQDLLTLEFRLRNFWLLPGSPPTLERADKKKPSQIMVIFPPQHIAEEAFFEAAPGFHYYASVPPDQLTLLDQLNPNSEIDLGDLPRIFAQECSIYIPQQSIGEVDQLGSVWAIPDFGLINPGLSPTEDGEVWLEIVPVPDTQLPWPVRARLSARSQLVFDASGLPPINFTLSTLLQALVTGPVSPILSPVAEPDPGTAADPAVALLKQPDYWTTQIEAPYRLLVSPTHSGRWLHASQPVLSPAGWNELWHTRLAAPDGTGTVRDNAASIRAIWARDPEFDQYVGDTNANLAPAHTLEPFRMSLDAADRFNLVELTSNYSLGSKSNGPFARDGVKANRLMLSALGAWLDLRGNWNLLDLQDGIGLGLSVSEWRHRATLGRDQYVRVVYEGFLFPFGHRAALVKITERKFEDANLDGKATKVAYLRQRMFIIVREPEKQYGDASLTAVDSTRANLEVPVEHYLPFRSVRITNLVTPDLDPPGGGPGENQSIFWARRSGLYFPFHLRAADHDGSPVEFDAPLMFVALDANNKDQVGKVTGTYNMLKKPGVDPATCQLGGQPVAFAPSVEPDPTTHERPPAGSTVFETQQMMFGAFLPTNVDQLTKDRKPCFVPVMIKANSFIPDFRHLAGNTGYLNLRYPLLYLQNGFDGVNGIEAFAELVDDNLNSLPTNLSFKDQADRSGALLTPNMSVTALSRTVGPAVGGDLAQLGNGGAYIWKSIFSGTAPKLLGQFALDQVVSDANPAPTVKTARPSDGSVLYLVDWEANQLVETKEFKHKQNSSASLSLHVTTTIPADQGPPRTVSDGAIHNFGLSLFGCLLMEFNGLRFRSETGRKPDVIADIAGVKFMNALSFVDKLAQVIPPDCFSDPPELAVTSDGLTARYGLAVPTVGLGIFSLQHLSFGAELALPFVEKSPSMRFHFAERQAPFTLTVGPFGGGGFFGLELTTTKIQVLELSFEFGASISVNFGVASGCIYAMGGLYIKLEAERDKLVGYFRMGGEVDVLGLISASIELYMELGYEAGKAVGRASITVEVEILFFSMSVEIGCERRFAGSSGDPTFAEIMGPYYIHKQLGQMLYTAPGFPALYLDPYNEDRAFLFNPATTSYGPQTVPTPKDIEPCRPNSTAPPEAELKEPWKEYCRAFVI